MGGSTEVFVDLTNELNSRGYDTTFYGPHRYHKDKCQSGGIEELNILPDDICIFHCMKLADRPDCKEVILSSHETDVFPLNQTNLLPYDRIHFVSEHQRAWHNVDFPNFIIPNLPPKLRKSPPLDRKIGGVVGTIMENKQTHLAIQWALDDGCEEVHLFGNIGEFGYWDTEIKPLLSDRVIHRDWTDKQTIYDTCSDFYCTSKYETFYMPGLECKITGRNMHIAEWCPHKNMNYLTNRDYVIDCWVKELGL